ncbi:MAG: hypothetical protein QG650_181 [Patescibacteria group bacterium]|nr:hypothetical protein [Patescibacteria group bacterium]
MDRGESRFFGGRFGFRNLPEFRQLSKEHFARFYGVSSRKKLLVEDEIRALGTFSSTSAFFDGNFVIFVEFGLIGTESRENVFRMAFRTGTSGANLHYGHIRFNRGFFLMRGFFASSPNAVDTTARAHFVKIFAAVSFEKDVRTSFGPHFDFDVFAVFVHESDPFEEMGFLVRMGEVFGSDLYDHPFGRFAENGNVLGFRFGSVIQVERFVHRFRDRVKGVFARPACRTFERFRYRFESGSRLDAEVFFPESWAVKVGTLRTGEFFHDFFRTLRIADFTPNARFDRGGMIDFRQFSV